MTTDGIEGLLIETHNWGKTVAFWKALGYELEVETENRWGRLLHPSGGPYIFIAERPQNHALQVAPVITVRDAKAFVPPSTGVVMHVFERQHWDALEMLLADPDGRQVSVQAPLLATGAAK